MKKKNVKKKRRKWVKANYIILVSKISLQLSLCNLFSILKISFLEGLFLYNSPHLLFSLLRRSLPRGLTPTYGAPPGAMSAYLPVNASPAYMQMMGGMVPSPSPQPTMTSPPVEVKAATAPPKKPRGARIKMQVWDADFIWFHDMLLY